jgi:5-methyltetrahydropteroyltriglutamate--homocysteine methyltransferase
VDEVSVETAQPDLDPTVLAALPDKKVHVGVLNLRDHAVETPEEVARRIERALPYVPEARMVVAPDCGMKYLPRGVAFGKLINMVKGRDLVLGRLG